MKHSNSPSAPHVGRHGNGASRLFGGLSPYFRRSDAPDQDYRYEATLAVWVRCFLLVGCLIETNYRIEYGALSHILNTLYILGFMAVNGYVYHRLRSGHRVSRLWLFVLSVLDVALVSFSVSMSGAFDSRYFVMYYPMAALFAWVFTSPLLGFSWTTMVVGIYVALCLGVAGGLDFGLLEEKALFYRVLSLYGVAGFVNILTRFERIRRVEAVGRELDLREDRIELSRTIHDTVAQSVYVVGLGIETARDIAQESSAELVSRLDEVHALSKTALWELRHPIDSGHIFEGRDLEEALNSHAYSFNAIMDIPVEVLRAGNEPDLPPLTRGLLFAIVHNAMTNVLLHAQASRVEVSLDFQDNHLCLSVSDDGIGLHRDRDGRGHGLRNMAANAERMGGSLEVSAGIGGAGTKVTCVVPYYANAGGMWSVSDGTDQSDAG